MTHNGITTCDCGTKSLRKLVKENFKKGDPIGVTFVGTDVLLVAVGEFLELRDEAIVVKNIFNLPEQDSISFIPLTDTNSIEKLEKFPDDPSPVAIRAK
ncbi:hypothetical protein [Cytobacillus sp. IB215665]|uniref:hypothetical protein n=1 Tax=Cytobacillus sp. IB215665 TaxID=3097357 RepID=UPI002A170CDB|nr:hypothetical protein [Cytobacillus sp. IB215665]MDX8366796.1 hypothetical protein [Cytobacillus sp. IB215665]